MNSHIISTGLFLAAAASFPLQLVSPVAAAFIVTIAGALSVMLFDYGRQALPIRLPEASDNIPENRNQGSMPVNARIG